MNGCHRGAILGIGLGQRSVQVLVARPSGGVLGQAVAGYPVRVPAPGRAEADPQDWWAAARRAVPVALAEAGEPAVTGLAVGGPLPGVVLADERGAALRPAIVARDRRAAAEAVRFAQVAWFTEVTRGRARPGGRTAPPRGQPSPDRAGPLLCWLAAREPRTLDGCWWALPPRDWLVFRLTERAATDPAGAAGTLLFDRRRGTWAEPLITALDLPWDKLPPVRPSGQPIGPLRPGPAADLGLPPGIAVTAIVPRRPAVRAA